MSVEQLLELQRLLNLVTQPEYLADSATLQKDELIKYLQLEKYYERVKELRRFLNDFLTYHPRFRPIYRPSSSDPKWTDKQQLLDSKIQIVDLILKQKRKQYAEYMMRQQNEATQGKQRIEALTKPLNLESLSADAPARSPVVPTDMRPKPALQEREELLLRNRIRPAAAQPQSSTSKASHQQEHDEIAGDLLIQARNLKRINLQFKEHLDKDKAVVKESELLMNSNAAKFKREHQNLKTFRVSSWKSTKSTILMLFLLFALFVVMYLLIKVTSK